jgi:hypothetical protein
MYGKSVSIRCSQVIELFPQRFTGPMTVWLTFVVLVLHVPLTPWVPEFHQFLPLFKILSKKVIEMQCNHMKSLH